jgi:hypothetical protein
MNAEFKYGNATLEELERDNWGEPSYPSHLETECHRLRRVQLRSLTPENLRVLIGQNIGLQFLVPLALQHLRANPLAQGDFYPGDLLCAVLRAKPEFWAKDRTSYAETKIIADKARSLAVGHAKVAIRSIEEALAVFLKV